MAIPTVAVGGKVTAGEINLLAGGVNGIALSGIIPTSIAGTGVTVSANGAVTFTNASTVSLNGVFSGTYTNYRIVWNSPTRSTNNTMYLRLRQAGTDVTSTTYNWAKGYDSANVRTSQSGTTDVRAPLDVAAGASMTSDGYTDIFGPANGGYTSGIGSCAVFGTGVPYAVQTMFQNSSTSSFDGFTMYVSGGTFTGTLRVYGYNNLT